MSPHKTDEERLAALQARKAALEADARKIRARINKKERNARTRRLIEIGATMEKALGYEIPAEDLPKLADFVQAQERRGNFLSKALGHTPTTETPHIPAPPAPTPTGQTDLPHHAY